MISGQSLRHVMVTGATGYIGRHLVAALCRDGVAVTALVRTPGNDGPDGVRLVAGDILDARFLASVLEAQPFDAIFHLAGLNAAAGPDALRKINVTGTETLLRAVRVLDRPSMRMILAGSSAEYGASPDNPITEDSVPAPVGEYGVSKLAATHMGQALHAATGQAVICLRPFNVIGPGACANLLHADVARQIVEIETKNRPPVLQLRDLSGYRDFVDVRDVARGFLALAEHGVPGQIYNLCTEQAVQAAELVAQLMELAQRQVTVETASAPCTAGDVPYQRGSFRKAKNAAGWAPGITLGKSLTDTLIYWRKAGNSAQSARLGGEIPEAFST